MTPTKPQSLEQLLPCPFCGDKALVRREDSKVCCFGIGDCRLKSVWFTKEQWNARHTQPPSVQPDDKSVDFVELLELASKEVKGKHLFRDWIEATPLENDIPVWMAEFAKQAITQHSDNLRKELEYTKTCLEEAQQWIDSEPDWKDKYMANYQKLQSHNERLVEALKDIQSINTYNDISEIITKAMSTTP